MIRAITKSIVEKLDIKPEWCRINRDAYDKEHRTTAGELYSDVYKEKKHEKSADIPFEPAWTSCPEKRAASATGNVQRVETRVRRTALL